MNCSETGKIKRVFAFMNISQKIYIKIVDNH